MPLRCLTGRAAREAAAGLGVLPERLAAGQRSELEALVAALRMELRRAAESLANNETTALARLDARLAVGMWVSCGRLSEDSGMGGKGAGGLGKTRGAAIARLGARLMVGSHDRRVFVVRKPVRCPPPQAVEGSLSGLEVAQSEGLRRLSMSISSALADAEASLQAGVRNEVARWVLDWPALPRALVEAGGSAERGDQVGALMRWLVGARG